jgi:hypothetical protein
MLDWPCIAAFINDTLQQPGDPSLFLVQLAVAAGMEGIASRWCQLGGKRGGLEFSDHVGQEKVPVAKLPITSSPVG